MSSRKRKDRGHIGAAGVLMAYRPPTYKRRRASAPPFRPGRDRVGGFYGRFAGRGGELKFHDVDLDDAFIATGGNVTASINLIAQGTSESQRIGRKCTLKSMFWRFTLTLPQRDAIVNPSAGDDIRIIVFLDKQCNGAAAVATDILETDDIHAFRNLSNSGRFVFCYDKVHSINYLTMASDGAAVVSQGGITRYHTMYKRLNTPLEFNSTTGVIAEIRSNNLGIMLVGTNAVAGINSKIRLRFSDN